MVDIQCKLADAPLAKRGGAVVKLLKYCELNRFSVYRANTKKLLLYILG